jgi:hypothetical protein
MQHLTEEITPRLKYHAAKDDVSAVIYIEIQICTWGLVARMDVATHGKHRYCRVGKCVDAHVQLVARREQHRVEMHGLCDIAAEGKMLLDSAAVADCGGGPCSCKPEGNYCAEAA